MFIKEKKITTDLLGYEFLQKKLLNKNIYIAYISKYIFKVPC